MAPGLFPCLFEAEPFCSILDCLETEQDTSTGQRSMLYRLINQKILLHQKEIYLVYSTLSSQQLLVMELSQTVYSAMKKQKKENIKKKRLTFLDEVDAVRAELKPRVIKAKTTTFLTFGLCLVKSFSQHGLDIVGATYNSRTRRLVLADGKGLFSLDLVPSNSVVKRELGFQKYQFNMVRIVNYCEKYNVYFVLQKDFAIKVYNKNYLEVCSIENPGSGWLTFISFNPVKDEVICGGVKGVKIWKFKEKEVPDYSNPDTLFNYSLVLSTEYTHLAKKWCTNMDFDVILQRFYCFSDSHFFCYDINGNLLLEIPNAHQSAILSCVYSSDTSILVTSSKGTEIKSWNDQGCLLHVFQGHTKAVTKVLLHPTNTNLFISGSLDGSIKLWSLATMELFYSFSPFQDGILWMSTIDNTLLYCCTVRDLHIYNLNSFTSFWAHVHSPIRSLGLGSADGKSSRVVVMSIDNSLRIFSLHNAMKLCTVLPPPSPPLIQPVLSFTYNRASGTVYLLLTPYDIWVYTARTDPACLAAVWTTEELQQHLYRKHPLASCIQSNEYFQHTRKRNFRTSVRCECLCSLSSPLCYLIDEGVVYADNQEFLVLGMQDGRILFLHTSIQNLVYYEMTAYTDPVIHLRHDVAQKQLIIMCQRPKCRQIHFRSLPALELIYSVDTTNDTNVFTRLNNVLFLGMESGAVDILHIPDKDDQIAFSKEDMNHEENEQKDRSDYSENYHMGTVVAVDSCRNLSIFLSCGSDFVIKLWDLQKKLIAEITLDNTLSTACFLNNSGDILLAFKNDLHLLSHDKILDLPKLRIAPSKVPAAESFIFESQTSDEQEKNKADVSKAAEMESYLIPYKGFSFTEDFTSELLVLPKKEKGGLPMASSKIYCSPCTSEASLKIYDFLLQPSTPNLEEQDKAELSRRMIVTKDMKYVPGPKEPPECEIPFFGVSPGPSLIFEQFQTETKPRDEVPDTESELSNAEFLQEASIKEQQQINEETASELTATEAPEIVPGGVCYLKEKQILQHVQDSSVPEKSLILVGPSVAEKRNELSYKRESRVQFLSWKPLQGQRFTTVTEKSREASEIRKTKEHKKLSRKENLSIKKIKTPKHARRFSTAKGTAISRDLMYSPCTISTISIGEKEHPASESKVHWAGALTLLGPSEKDLASPEKRLFSEKTEQKKVGGYESREEKNTRVAAQRKKEHERIQQAEEQRLRRDLEKKTCSRNHPFTPTNSRQYSNIESSAYFPETLFAWMKPHRQVVSRPCTVMEETTISLPRDYPYRLAWEKPTSEVLDIKLYYPKKGFPKDTTLSTLLLDKGLQPTKSIPDKGKYILVNEPVSESSLPALSPLENKLLSVRFPRQKERILQAFLSNLKEPP